LPQSPPPGAARTEVAAMAVKKMAENILSEVLESVYNVVLKKATVGLKNDC
jgi:hypothetical protein